MVSQRAAPRNGVQEIQELQALLQVSHDGQYIDGGKFPPSLGSFTMVPKATKGKPFDRTRCCYLDAIHVDIVFGDCLSVDFFSLLPHPGRQSHLIQLDLWSEGSLI